MRNQTTCRQQPTGSERKKTTVPYCQYCRKYGGNWSICIYIILSSCIRIPVLGHLTMYLYSTMIIAERSNEVDENFCMVLNHWMRDGSTNNCATIWEHCTCAAQELFNMYMLDSLCYTRLWQMANKSKYASENDIGIRKRSTQKKEWGTQVQWRRG